MERPETESIELSKAEAVAVWYGSIVSTQQLGQAAKKKCKERELLKLAYWKINRPK
jgi:hypothetical protein